MDPPHLALYDSFMKLYGMIIHGCVESQLWIYLYNFRSFNMHSRDYTTMSE